MRVRTNIILSEDVLAKIDLIAGEKNKRAAVIETALREFIAREESKKIGNKDSATVEQKVVSTAK